MQIAIVQCHLNVILMKLQSASLISLTRRLPCASNLFLETPINFLTSRHHPTYHFFPQEKFSFDSLLRFDTTTANLRFV